MGYRNILLDPEFVGRWSLLAPMTLGQRAHLEVQFRGGGKAASAPATAPHSVRSALIRESVKAGASESAAVFWYTADAEPAHG